MPFAFPNSAGIESAPNGAHCIGVKGMAQDQDGLWIINAEANTIFANERMAEILGETVAEMIGRPSFAYVFPEDQPAAQRLFESKMQGNADPFRFRLRRRGWTSCCR